MEKGIAASNPLWKKLGGIYTGVFFLTHTVCLIKLKNRERERERVRV